MFTIQFDSTSINVYPDRTLIIFADGSTIAGAPENTDSYRATALRHGYGEDTLQMCKEHEVMHIALCHWLGIPSPTMTLLRTGENDQLHELNRLEEAAVLAIQHFARVAGIDLLAQMAQVRSS